MSKDKNVPEQMGVSSGTVKSQSGRIIISTKSTHYCDKLQEKKLTSSKYEREFLIHCDDGSLKKVKLSGRAAQIMELLISCGKKGLTKLNPTILGVCIRNHICVFRRDLPLIIETAMVKFTSQVSSGAYGNYILKTRIELVSPNSVECVQ